MDIYTKINKLKEILKGLQPGIIAVSGGLDSTVLAKFITLCNFDFKGVFFKGNHITNYEHKWAKRIFKDIGLDYTEFEINLLNLKEIKENKKNRCYICKNYLFSTIRENAGNRTIIEGSHVDDQKEFRPGMDAMKELGVVSPYELVDMTKKDISILGRELGLPVDRFPTRPCLLTRFPYNLKIDPNILASINIAESYILELGFKNFRIRRINREFKLHVLNRDKDVFLRIQDKIISKLKMFNINITEIVFKERLSGFFDR